MNTEQLKIKQAVLKAVRKISGAAFSNKLGDFYISFTVRTEYFDVILWIGDDIAECYNSIFGLSGCNLISVPSNVNDIARFEVDVEKGLSEIFEYVRLNHE